MTTQHNPPHPGEFIKETYIKPLDISLRKAAHSLDVTASTFSRLVQCKSSITPTMALKLSKAFGRTPESWMQMQSNYDLWEAKQYIDLRHVDVIYMHA